MTNDELSNNPLGIYQLRAALRLRTMGNDYWRDEVGPKDAEEAERLYNELIENEEHLERILVARKYDETKSADLFLEQVTFRAKYRPLDIDPSSIPNALPSGAWRISGFSRQGCVVSNYKLYLWEPSDYAENIEEAVDEYVRYVCYMIELMIGLMKPHPNPQQFVVLFDLSGFSASLVFRTNVRLMIRKLIYVAQAQYPERLFKALLVNAPFGFETAWNLICPLLDEKTAGKISFCPIESLNEEISQYVLTRDYGGIHDEYPIPSRSINEEVKLRQEAADVENAN